MIINVIGPVGSGKSTLAKNLAIKLGLKYIPEVEDNDVKFFRLLKERNTTQLNKDKLEFQCYTFEQAFARQYNQGNCVIDVPLIQHIVMAKASLSEKDYKKYLGYYEQYLNKVRGSKIEERVINLVIYAPFDETLERIKSRGRKEETLSEKEIEFYSCVYYNILANFGAFNAEGYIEDSDNWKFIFNDKDIETVLSEAIDKINKESNNGRKF